MNFLEQLRKTSTISEISGDIHFVVACFIRGGVFSFSDGSKAVEKKKKELEKAAKKEMKENKRNKPEESIFQ